VSDWEAPDGIVTVDIDPTTGQLATAGCPGARNEVFIAGTQPVELCRVHGGGTRQVAGWDTAPAAAAPTSKSAREAGSEGDGPARSSRSIRINSTPVPSTTPGQAPAEKKTEEKKGFFGRIRDVFK